MFLMILFMSCLNSLYGNDVRNISSYGGSLDSIYVSIADLRKANEKLIEANINKQILETTTQLVSNLETENSILTDSINSKVKTIDELSKSNYKYRRYNKFLLGTTGCSCGLLLIILLL